MPGDRHRKVALEPRSWVLGTSLSKGADDRDYYVDEGTLALLEESGADTGLIAVLRAAVAPAGDGEVRWSRD